MPTKSPYPLSGGFAPNTYNFIKKLVFHECSVPFIVYVETFIPCAIEMLLMITVPFWDDLVRDTAYTMASDAHGSKRPRRGHVRNRETERARERVRGKTQQGLRHLLRFTQPLETIGYMFLLYHATERFFFNWTSLLYDFEHCGKPPSEGPLIRTSGPQSETASGTLNILELPDVQVNRAGWPTDQGVVTVPFGHYSVTLEVEFQSQVGNDQWAECVIYCAANLGPTETSSGRITLKSGQKGTVIAHAELFIPLITGGDIRWYTRAQAAPVGIGVDEALVQVVSFQPGR